MSKNGPDQLLHEGMQKCIAGILQDDIVKIYLMMASTNELNYGDLIKVLNVCLTMAFGFTVSWTLQNKDQLVLISAPKTEEQEEDRS